MKLKVGDDEEGSKKQEEEDDEDDDDSLDDYEPLDQARKRLLILEKNIERRYLKPPLARG